MRRFSHPKTEAQALVEFALSATVIFLLLAAAVDLGLLFFTQQSITNAAQEGATYGSRWLKDKSGPAGMRELNVAEIQRRVRYESGENGGSAVARLTDLNSDGIDDASQPTLLDPNSKDSFIQVRAIVDANLDANPSNDTEVCTNPASNPLPCYAVVTVRKTYKFFFPFSPAFGNQYTIASTYYLLIRDSYEVAGGINPVITTPVPTPSPAAIKVVAVSPLAGAKITAIGQTSFEVKAWDDAKSPGGTTNGAGITKVVMNLYGPTGALIATQAGDSAPKFCLYGGNCSKMSTSQWNGFLPGTYTLQATATATDGRTGMVTVTFTK